MLSSGVGQGENNRPRDVQCVRALLNVHRRRRGETPLPIDGTAGQELTDAIARFQTAHGVDVATGAIPPGSPSWRWLLADWQSSRSVRSLNPPSVGKLTWDAEGVEGGADHSRSLRVPGPSEGVTIGRGYRLRDRSSVEVQQNLATAGGHGAGMLAAAAHLRGDVAHAFVIERDLLDFEISPDVQLRLFQVMMQPVELRVKQKLSGGPAWGAIDSRLRDVLLDLEFCGQLQVNHVKVLAPALATNDRQQVLTVLQERSHWQNVPLDRQQRRCAHLN